MRTEKQPPDQEQGPSVAVNMSAGFKCPSCEKRVADSTPIGWHEQELNGGATRTCPGGEPVVSIISVNVDSDLAMLFAQIGLFSQDPETESLVSKLTPQQLTTLLQTLNSQMETTE